VTFFLFFFNFVLLNLRRVGSVTRSLAASPPPLRATPSSPPSLPSPFSLQVSRTSCPYPPPPPRGGRIAGYLGGWGRYFWRWGGRWRWGRWRDYVAGTPSRRGEKIKYSNCRVHVLYLGVGSQFEGYLLPSYRLGSSWLSVSISKKVNCRDFC
jgi:hypothetical protein